MQHKLKPLWPDFTYQPHQIVGVEWMLDRESVFPQGGLLCDEMGLGKTIQILSLMKHNKVKSTLLLAPLCTLDQWQETAERSGIQVWRCNKSKSEWDMPANFNPSAVQMYLINYERAIARNSLVIGKEWGRAVFDEAHRLGREKNLCYKLARQIKATHRWLLTATPIVNRIENAMCLMRLVGYSHIPSSLEGMKPFIQESVLCRRMSDLRDTMPWLPKEANEIKHLLDFDTEEEEEFYRGIQGVLTRRWKALEMEQGGMMEIFRLIMRLRQISIHPQVYISSRKKNWTGYTRDDWVGSSTKFNKLKTIIESDADEPHRWIVFCHFHEEMSMLQEFLLTSPVIRNVNLYHGGMDQNQKRDSLDKSKENLTGSEQEVLLVQLQSGGVGLNLQHCDRIVFMSPWWTAALMDQAIGRAIRIGQKEEVVVHRLVLKEEDTMNIDRKMMEAAERKRGLCEEFLGMAAGLKKETDSELPILS